MDNQLPNFESAETFKLLVEQVKDYAIFMLDTEGIIRSWNEGARRIKGYEASEVVGKHFSIFYPKQDVDNNKPAFELQKAQEMGRYEEEGWRLRKDGSLFWANVIITPLRGREGKLTGFAKVTRDLTQRKLQEENLQSLLDSEERFRLLVEQVQDYAIFFLDPKGNVSSWNQGARRIKGYTSDEIIGRHFSTFYTPEDIARDHPAHELSLAIQDGRYEEEGWRIKKDGSKFWASVLITSLWNKKGNLTGFAKVTRDLSDKRRKELALRSKTEELEGFAHSLSHDLRGPLRSIIGFAQLLNEEGVSAEQRAEFGQKIIRSATSMEQLIGGMLKLSHISLTAAELEQVSVKEVLDECVSLLERERLTAGAKIQITGTFPILNSNRVLLFQIFSNLLTNAIRYAKPGTPATVEVFSAERDSSSEIHVRDHGVGVPAAHQKTIFNLFNRGTVRDDRGMGIGLTIVKKAADRLGGQISLVSEEGTGSDFILTLPSTKVDTSSSVEASTGQVRGSNLP